MSGVQLLLSDARGQYIPRDFAEECAHWQGIDEDDLKILADPDHEHYWEVWDDVLSNATFTDKDGHVWTLYQDGDCWAICDALMTLEEKKNFEFDIDDQLEEILEANEGFEVVKVPEATRTLGEWTWTSVEGDAKDTWVRWTDAAYDCVTQNMLELPVVDTKTLPLFPQ